MQPLPQSEPSQAQPSIPPKFASTSLDILSRERHSRNGSFGTSTAAMEHTTVKSLQSPSTNMPPMRRSNSPLLLKSPQEKHPFPQNLSAHSLRTMTMTIPSSRNLVLRPCHPPVLRTAIPRKRHGTPSTASSLIRSTKRSTHITVRQRNTTARPHRRQDRRSTC